MVLLVWILTHIVNIQISAYFDSINKIPDMLITANNLGMKGIVLTDHECLSGHLKWLQAEENLKEKNILPNDFKAGLGNEIYLVEDRQNIEKYWHYILIAKNNTGHRALRELSSKAWYYGYSSRGMMRVPTEMNELEDIVKKYPNSLIATNACIGGFLGNRVLALVKAENKKKIDKNEIYSLKKDINDFILWNKNLFGDDFYLEIAAGQSNEQRKFNERVKNICNAYKLKMIIGSDAHYLTAKERPLHKAYLNSKEGEREVDQFYWDAHMMNNDEAYGNLKDFYTEDEFIQICNNSMEIYNKIEGYNLYHKPIIPEVSVKEYPINVVYNIELNNYPIIKTLLNGNLQERYWVNQCLEGLIDKKLINEIYLNRLETEARVISIIGEKLEDCLFKYFNTFQHFIDLFWRCGSIVGPGRGSSVCFLSNYLMGITQLDPVEWELPYFRFLNEERVELPDIDIDLSPSKRKKIFEEIRKERGELNLIQVATFGTEGTRQAIASAGRGYRSEEYPDGLDTETTQYLSSLIPQERGFLPSIHEIIYGNESKGKKPIQAFIDEVNKYPGLLEIIEGIEGLVCRRGEHASGVMLYNNSPFETNAIMRSPNGDLTTQFELHDSDKMGDTKFDTLVTEICDKITICIELLQKENIIDKNLSLREVYNQYLHPAVLNTKDQRLWDALSNGEVLDVFQFSTGVGLDAAKTIKPQNPTQLTSANCLMRLMGEKGKERPLDRYCRLKNDMSLWYKEVQDRGLTQEEIKILEPYYLPNFGVPASQEDLMLVCMDKQIAHFTLKEANSARKIVAKKDIKKVPELKEKFLEQCPNEIFGQYVWETVMEPQMSYSFAKPHGLAYSFVGIQTLYLATNFPSVFWNCACLIVKAGGAELLNLDVNDEDEEENEKKKNKNANYGKISTAIGECITRNIQVLPPDINKSQLIFYPDIKTNSIIYGLKGLSRIGDNIIIQIMQNRPYNSIVDFLSKVKVNKTQMVSLIKSGSFDNLYSNMNRKEIMYNYLELIADKKKRITLQNMQMLITKKLIPDYLNQQVKIFNFNKYLKKNKQDKYYLLDNISFNFYSSNYDIDNLNDVVVNEEERSAKIEQKIWDNIYKKEMNPVRDWMKENQQEILTNLNKTLIDEIAEKYAEGNIAKWEMDSLSFYYHEHELNKLKTSVYEISDYTKLNPEPKIKNKYETKDNKVISIYELYRIAGTVIDKDKNKSSVTLLTPSGVVNVKIWKNQYAKWDKQISQRDIDGKKHVLEKSWFTRGTKLIITGIRRGDSFVPKKYKSTEWPLFEKINKLSENGFILDSSTERIEIEED